MGNYSHIGLKIITRNSVLNLPQDLPLKFNYNFETLKNQLAFLQIRDDIAIEANKNNGLYIVINGRGEISSNNEHFKFQSGDIIFVSSGTEHTFLNCDESTQAWAVFGAE